MTTTKTKPVSIREAAYSKIPGWDVRTGLMRQLGVRVLLPSGSPVAVTLTKPDAVGALESKIEALLLAGKPVPDDIAQSVIDAERHDALIVARAQAMNTIASNYADVRSIVNKRTTGAAFEYLATELATLVDQVRAESDNLRGITNATDAIDGGSDAVASWRAVAALEPRYREIREVQFDLMDASVGQSTVTLSRDNFTDSGHFRRSADALPSWIDRRRQSAIAVSANGRPNILAYREWLMNGSSSPAFTPGIDPVHALVLMCTTLDPWIPSLDEFEDERKIARFITMTPDPNVIEQMTTARDAYLAGQTVSDQPTATRTLTPSPERAAQLEHKAAQMRMRAGVPVSILDRGDY